MATKTKGSLKPATVKKGINRVKQDARNARAELRRTVNAKPPEKRPG